MNGSNETSDSSSKCPSHEVIKPIISFALVLSVTCIIITIFVYVLLSETRTLHGKILISLSTCLGTMYTLLFLDVYLQPFLPFSVCVAMGTLTYVMFIATFFWLNVMTYDLWKTVCRSTAASGSSHGKKYLRYSAYAWTSTVFTCMPMIVVQNTDLVPEEFHPGLGKNVCWFVGKISALVFMSAPIGIILFVNLVMFILTTKTLVEINNLTQIFQVRQNKIKFKLYFKLFLVMGLVWVTDFIPFIFRDCHLYLVADVLNSLHGFFLFLIFICKKKIMVRFFNFRKRCACFSYFKKSSFRLNSENVDKNFDSGGSFSTTTTDF